MGLYARKPKLRYHSYKGEVGKVAPNILQRDFEADAPNRKWTTDVTQVDIRGKKCYLSPILDMWNGEVISYVISDHPDLKMVTDMLQKAFPEKLLKSVSLTKMAIMLFLRNSKW